MAPPVVSGPTVLVSAGDPQHGARLARLLLRRGHAARHVADAAAELDAAGAEEIGCLVVAGGQGTLPLAGPQVLEWLRPGSQPLPVVMLAGTDPLLDRAARDALLAALTQAVERQARRRPAAPPAWAQQLSPREREVMARVVRGEQNKQIAADLGISYRTVEIHRSHLMQKLGLRNVAELIRLHLGAGAAMA